MVEWKWPVDIGEEAHGIRNIAAQLFQVTCGTWRRHLQQGDALRRQIVWIDGVGLFRRLPRACPRARTTKTLLDRIFELRVREERDFRRAGDGRRAVLAEVEAGHAERLLRLPVANFAIALLAHLHIFPRGDECVAAR